MSLEEEISDVLKALVHLQVKYTRTEHLHELKQNQQNKMPKRVIIQARCEEASLLEIYSNSNSKIFIDVLYMQAQ